MKWNSVLLPGVICKYKWKACGHFASYFHRETCTVFRTVQTVFSIQSSTVPNETPVFTFMQKRLVWCKEICGERNWELLFYFLPKSREFWVFWGFLCNFDNGTSEEFSLGAVFPSWMNEWNYHWTVTGVLEHSEVLQAVSSKSSILYQTCLFRKLEKSVEFHFSSKSRQSVIEDETRGCVWNLHV